MGRRFFPVLFSLVVLLAVQLPMQALAADPERPAPTDRATLEEMAELLRLMQVRKVIKVMMPPLRWDILDAMREQAPQALPRHLEEAATEIDQVLKKRVSRYMDAVIALYYKRLTGEEVRAIIAFYKSPLGASAMRKLTDSGIDVGNLTAEYGRAMAMEALEAGLESLRKKGYAL